MLLALIWWNELTRSIRVHWGELKPRSWWPVTSKKHSFFVTNNLARWNVPFINFFWTCNNRSFSWKWWFKSTCLLHAVNGLTNNNFIWRIRSKPELVNIVTGEPESINTSNSIPFIFAINVKRALPTPFQLHFNFTSAIIRTASQKFVSSKYNKSESVQFEMYNRIIEIQLWLDHGNRNITN